MMISKSFPKELEKDVKLVMSIIASESHSCTQTTFTFDLVISYKLKDEIVVIPYRMYYDELPNIAYKDLTERQFKILCCLYTRHHNGYIRQKYLKKLFDMKIDEWEIPFIIKLCDEYVLEILELVYNKLTDRNNDDIRQFCLNNQLILHKSYNRMISYWNVYYRDIDNNFRNYVGRKLFKECFGYNKKFNYYYSK